MITALAFQLVAAAKQPLRFDDLINCQRLSDPQYAPDGSWIAFSVKTAHEPKNSYHTDIWMVKPDGSDLKQLTTHAKSSWHPRWSPDGKQLAFISNRSGKSHIWILPMDGGEARQLTTHYTGVGDFSWSPSGKYIALTSRVYPECPDQDCVRQRDEREEKSAIQARVYEDLMFRHWDTWWDHKRSHIFVLTVENGEMVDVTPGNFDAPPISLGYGYCFSLDEKQLFFTSNHDSMIAISTNNDIWSVAVTGGTPQLVTQPGPTRDFKGNDYLPRFGPQGRRLAFLSMRRSGYEADKRDLMLKDMQTGKYTNLTTDLKYSVSNFEWLPQGKRMLLRIDQKGRYRIFSFDLETRALKPLIKNGYNRSLTLHPSGERFAYLHQSFTSPYELMVASTRTGAGRQITSFNQELLADVDMHAAEDFWFEGAAGTQVHGFLIKPPGFDSQKQWPMVFMVHGGPQGAWHDGWHYRWNAELWAAQGYVMILINPRGSTGYGQEFKEDISKDWGGKVFRDLIAGQQYVLETYDFIDKERIAAAGASFGGYMMNWFEGHMDQFPYPFKTLINHDGTFNIYSKYLTTEELWFPEWEFGGPYWELDKYYEKFSPHRFVENFTTPMLIIHGEKDYRLDFSEGLMPFTALRRQGIEAKLVLFPDEGHWVLKPQNSRFWHETVFDWLAAYLK